MVHSPLLTFELKFAERLDFSEYLQAIFDCQTKNL